MPIRIQIPELSLVALIGPSGAGKSTFARRHFLPTETLSSDFFRGLVSDDENSLEATKDAFASLHFVLEKRLAAGRLTVIDATNVQPEARASLVEIARRHHVLCSAIVLNLPESVCHDRNAARPGRDFGPHVVRQQSRALRRGLRGLAREGFRYVHELSSPEEVDEATVERVPLWTNRRGETGPFDIIGDVHGCFEELSELMERLGYVVAGSNGEAGEPRYLVSHPEGRRAIFLGDLVDRGPGVVPVLRLAMDMVESGVALCVPGNHEEKLLRKLRGKDVKPTHGLAATLEQMEPEGAAFRERVRKFIDGLVSHYVLDGGRLVVAHAGLKAEMQGRASGAVRSFALYGDTTGETDDSGLPVRLDWAKEYRGSAMVVYGHTPVPEPQWLNRAINIDTGCVFGGGLTALRYPERELVTVPARRVHCEPVRPLRPAPGDLSAQQSADDALDLADVTGKRVIETRLMRAVIVRAENSAAALEVMSRFAVNPKWLIYLPPTMSPVKTSREPGWLERPEEAFEYYREEGIARVVCEEKHMGSRAVLIVGKDEAAIRRSFGVENEGAGICYTRTGRRFFNDRALEAELIARASAAMEASGLWEELESDWVCLDCELMPWSAKAQELLREQYAPVGAAAASAMPEALRALEAAIGLDPAVQPLLERYRERAALTGLYSQAWRRYCWPVGSLDDLRIAPFHVIASEGRAHFDRDHFWHMEIAERLALAGGPLFMATTRHAVDLADPAAVAEGIAWWEGLIARGGEGMVVKPVDFIARGRKGVVQPAVKCRGREYLRIIYGPEYTLPEHLTRLRERSLGGKRALAMREFALGVEGVERFIRREPLRRVHECVFGVLAMESEPIDPRL